MVLKFRFQQWKYARHRFPKKIFVAISVIAMYTMLNISFAETQQDAYFMRHSDNESLKHWEAETMAKNSLVHSDSSNQRLNSNKYHIIAKGATTVAAGTIKRPVLRQRHTFQTEPNLEKKVKRKKLDTLVMVEVNLTTEEINANNYSPVPGAGEYGRPVLLQQHDWTQANNLHILHNYNLVVGDKISIERNLRDVRFDSCINKEYDLDKLPSASIIIIYYNEAWSTLMRTVMSVLMRSPKQLIKEILLVDDGSDRRYLGKELDDAVAKLDKVRILRQPIQRGIAKSRLMGATAATADVLVFLDSHCEVTIGWLEPLLERAADADVYVCPVIDIIDKETFAYIRVNTSFWGAFDWRLRFRWYTPDDEVLKAINEDPTKPFPSPAMAGGLFAVKRTLFWRLGGYDEGMNIWGGENLEMSWRAWQCGARVEFALCSRVGHIFRYLNPVNILDTKSSSDVNFARAAMVWMDEWGEFYFKCKPSSEALREKIDVADRVRLRESLNCSSFEWYLKTVWPTHFFPTHDRWFGRIRNKKKGCLGVPASVSQRRGGLASLVTCGGDSDTMQLLVYTDEGQIMGRDGLCLEQGQGRAIWSPCIMKRIKQIWRKKDRRLVSSSGLCLTLVEINSTDSGGGDTEPITCQWCRRGKAQVWLFEKVSWH